MSSADLALDGALALALPLLAWRALGAEPLSRAVVLFVALGLLAAVAWGRLHAPDVALVEAAVGAGLTGALLMTSLGWVAPAPRERLPAAPRLALWALLAALGAALAWVVLGLPPRSVGLSDAVHARLEESGVSHPVTAVLLNFRGYDTLLEIVVLLVAALGVHLREAPAAAPEADPHAHPLFPVVVRVLVPPAVLLAGYLLWKGAHGTGGAFQSGAILGGAGILLVLTGTVRLDALSAGKVRAGLLFGPLVFAAVAVAPLALGLQLLQFPAGWAGALILATEAALTLSIAVVVLVFFSGVAR